MRFLSGWLLKLGVVGVAWLAVTGNLHVTLSDDLAYKAWAGVKQISDRIKATTLTN